MFFLRTPERSAKKMAYLHFVLKPSISAAIS